MGSLIRNIMETYKYVNEDLAHPVTRNYLLVYSPFCVIVGLFVYYKFVTLWGPEYMADRPPFDVKKPMIVYNIAQIIISAVTMVGGLSTTYLNGHYNLWCQGVNYEDNEGDDPVLYYTWLYATVKVLDLVDTIFFILRKKFSHASFLHVYHHMAMVVLGYMGLKYVPGGHGAMLGIINSMVHTVMYSYYLVALVRPDWVRVWWKKYITQLQIAQFVAILLHFSHVLFQPSCEYPKWVVVLLLPQNLFMTALFVDFYIKEYIKKKKQ
ncbi:elongation of very long chain fatty acids protein AAEL008004-like [Aricia agestis]|uniref:elongation of very long chain fatty acids protein AAEL008004-like n=1 Tax=Aricia agestis TaxID=91739 RepID=UPI001C205EFC|nr:elongation of very long chain fatty acids protein AAEL008004-like [Aricia agestis]